MMRTSFISAALCLVLLLTIAAGCGRREEAPAERPSVSGSILSEGQFTIGDPIDILFTVISDRESRVGYPEDEEQLFPFKIRGITEKRTRVGKNTYRTLVIYSVAVFKTGPVTFPSLALNAGESVLRTEPMEIHVLSVLPKEEDALRLKDVVSPYRPRMRGYTVAIVLGSLLAASGIGYFLYRMWMKMKGRKKAAETPKEEPPDPYRYSIDELERVKNGYMHAAMETKQVYSEISLVLRGFMGSMLRCNAVRMTTGQLSRYLKRKKHREAPYRRFLNILKRSDLVKFAKESPRSEKVRSDIDESIGVVQEVHSAASGSQKVGGRET